MILKDFHGCPDLPFSPLFSSYAVILCFFKKRTFVQRRSLRIPVLLRPCLSLPSAGLHWNLETNVRSGTRTKRNKTNHFKGQCTCHNGQW